VRRLRTIPDFVSRCHKMLCFNQLTDLKNYHKNYDIKLLDRCTATNASVRGECRCRAATRVWLCVTVKMFSGKPRSLHDAYSSRADDLIRCRNKLVTCTITLKANFSSENVLHYKSCRTTHYILLYLLVLCH